MLQLKDGSTVEANCPNGLLFGTVAQPGMSVIVISSTVGQLSLHTVYNVDRTWPVYGFIAVFLALLRLIGGRKGVASAVALVLTFSCFIGFFFPMILRGMPPILPAQRLVGKIRRCLRRDHRRYRHCLSVRRHLWPNRSPVRL